VAKKRSKSDELQPIIIKRVKKVAGGHHHGGAWKVAYADFVTAMMAFFLLLWLLNIVVEDDLEAIASYYDPTHPRIADTISGAGGVMGGVTIAVEGAMTQDIQRVSGPRSSGAEIQQTKLGETGIKKQTTDQIEYRDLDLEKLEEELRKQEFDRFMQAKSDLEKALDENEALKDLAENLDVDITEEGLRIQILDQEGRAMFPSGSAQMHDYTKDLMGQVAQIINSLPNDISVRGHTDAHPYAQGASYTNWELSADRANSSRRVLEEFSIGSERFSNVMGKADQEPYLEEDPFHPSNRRISIILLNESLEHAADRGAFDDLADKNTNNIDLDSLPRERDVPVGTFKRTPGNVYFP
jgi:chemotaxis protein MotB